jgi:hypothetical protein
MRGVVIHWAQYHDAGYEVSTAGDARFSALRARLADGRTVEQHYQCDVKGYAPGGRDWRLGKGRKPLRECDLWVEYLNLWWQWAVVHRAEMSELRRLAAAHGGVLTDAFAKTPVNQAHALACILNATAP